MTYDGRELALLAVRHLLIGRQAVGMYWWNSIIHFALLKDGHALMPAPCAHLRAMDNWALVDEEGSQVRRGNEPGMPSYSDRQGLAKMVIDLYPHKVTGVDLGEHAPHLHVGFEDRSTLVVTGSHPEYESWKLECGDFLIVATPGDTVAVWTPDGFGEGDA